MELGIDAGNTSGCFPFETTEDDIFEANEQLTITLISTDTHIHISRSTAVVEITDDDGKFVVLL